MYQKIHNNFAYILNKKTSTLIIKWIQILIIILLVFLNVAFNYKYSLIDKYLGYVKNGNIVIYVLEENISNLKSLYISEKNYDFKIIHISSEYYLDNLKKYREVIIKTSLDDSLNIENNILNVEFNYGKTTIAKQIKKGMKKWIE